MKAEELFKTKAEVASKLDELGIEYPKIKSGVNIGKATQTFNDLCSLYDSTFFKVEEIKENKVVVFPTFNSMTFRYS
tara:strand:- start:7575 stop:7805 length:231 start_codon:yes stop_codon:yes gene_type:complete